MVVGCVGKVSEDCVGEVLPVEFETHSSCITEVWTTDGCEHGVGTTEICVEHAPVTLTVVWLERK